MAERSFPEISIRRRRISGDEEIQYYSHPLKRIVSQHSHQNELTGFPYFSPWPRSDAWPMRAY